ncbi:MAG: ATP-binding cassette domain-containing protein [Acidimicrobiia bacterium]|nr:ATP-binding cassette domain-containing protein [Acidimicrobiia bacterium]
MTAHDLGLLTWESDGRVVVAPTDLELRAGERLVVFGPNGAGKSTLLRLIAGVLGDRTGEDVAYLPQRPYMFRGSGRRNLLMGLAGGESNRAEVLAKRLGVSNLLGTPANRLSGGERQRLGLARTLASERPIIALDEPLAAIDARDRDTVIAVAGDAIGDRSAVVVTHDRDIAVAFADRVALMVDGAVRSIGPPQEIFLDPANEDVADLLGHQNVMVGTVVKGDGPLVQVSCAGLMVWALGHQPAGSEVRVTFGADAVTLHTVASASAAEGQDSARNHWLGAVQKLGEVGRLVEVVVDVGQPVAALITEGSMAGMGIALEDKVALSVKATAARAVTSAKQ